MRETWLQRNSWAIIAIAISIVITAMFSLLSVGILNSAINCFR